MLFHLPLDWQAGSVPSSPDELLGFELESLALDPGSPARIHLPPCPKAGSFIRAAREQSFFGGGVKVAVPEKKAKSKDLFLFLSPPVLFELADAGNAKLSTPVWGKS